VNRAQLALEFLRQHSVLTLATAGSDGPGAAAVFYACDGLDPIFLSAPNTRHGRHLAEDPRAAATVQDHFEDWSSIRGVQLHGTTTRLQGDSELQAQRQYAARFPAIFDSSQAASRVSAAMTKVHWYRFECARVRFVDNSLGFGHRDEWSREQFLQALESP
jgi:hypothetical protein